MLAKWAPASESDNRITSTISLAGSEDCSGYWAASPAWSIFGLMARLCWEVGAVGSAHRRLETGVGAPPATPAHISGAATSLGGGAHLRLAGTPTAELMSAEAALDGPCQDGRSSGLRVAAAGFDCRVVFGFGDLFIERDLENSSPDRIVIIADLGAAVSGQPNFECWCELERLLKAVLNANIVSTGQMFDDGFPEALSWVDLHTGHHALPEHRGVRQRF